MLVAEIARLHEAAARSVGQTLHRILSVRNWLIGAYVVAFEQGGEDRAEYGTQLLDKLAEALRQASREGLSARNLYNFRQVTLAYPELDTGPLHRSLGIDSSAAQIPQTSAESVLPLISQTSAKLASDAQAALAWRDQAWLQRLFSELSFSHLLELSRIDDPTRRAFYELHTLKESWSVRELQRQRNSMLYERVGLSENRDEVLALAKEGVIDERPAALIRDPYVFEFLGLRPSPALKEHGLEQALIEHLEQFLLELGRDFCFVDRQFRITAGNRHHYLDLLFFHRRLRCLVAVDLKLGEFQPEHAGKMRFYLGYLAEHVALPDENPPVGILLCADKDAEVVRFATVGDESVFVSRYVLELPSEERLRRWLHEERARLEIELAESEDDDGE